MGGIGDAGESKPPNNEKAGPAPGVWAHGFPSGDDGPEPYGRVPAINKGGGVPAPAVRFATVPGGDLKGPRHPEAAVLGLVHKASFR